ncbi:unnamed protein product [Scytosiphon promiscuus]
MRTASAWRDCVVSPDDKWKPATERTPALRMRYEFERRYTCSNERASFVAGSFYFDSPCMADKFFFPPDVRSCLKGRRVIFLGDSLSNQQGDSLLGMLGWDADWMILGHPRNAKQAVDEDGHTYNTLLDCWRAPENSARGVERCYDYSTRDFPPDMAEGDRWSTVAPAKVRAGEGSGKASALVAGRRPRRRLSVADAAKKADPCFFFRFDLHAPTSARGPSGQKEATEPPEVFGRVEVSEISVHMRMFSRPQDEHWLQRAMRDYNETRPSDVIVVNFGGHYHDGPEDEEVFKSHVFPILDDMAELGKQATVVWR